MSIHRMVILMTSKYLTQMVELPILIYNCMPNPRRIMRLVAPPILIKIIEATKLLASVPNHRWIEAFYPRTLIDINTSRLSILPISFRNSPQFVIDVGANCGQWIGALLQLLTIPEVWIFEPNPEAMKNCRQRIGQRPNVRFFDVALGDTDGKINLHLTALSNFASVLPLRTAFLEKHYSKNAARVVSNKEVELRKLDSLVPDSRSVDLLKIDVQGL